MSWIDKLSPEQKATAEKVVAYARKHGVPENLALGMAMQESSLNQNKKSKTGPVGVMQMSRAAAKDIGVDRHNADQNIEGGIIYTKQLLDRFGGDIDKTLAAYHDGPNSSSIKTGKFSPAAATHIEKVKGYAGMADNTGGSAPQFSVELEDVAPAARFDETTEVTGKRPRDITDVMAGVAGAGVGYGVGKQRQMSKHEKEIALSAQRLAIQQQRVAQEALDREAAAAKSKEFGSGTEAWKNTEYGEPIARQVKQPISKQAAVAEAKAAEARHNRASQVFPTQVQASPGSMLTIPVTIGGKTQMPAPAPEAPTAPLHAPSAESMPAMQVLRAPGRASTAATTAMGGLAGAQAYDAYKQLMEGNFGEAGVSGMAALNALLSAGATNPKVKALTGLGAAGLSFGPELYDYLFGAEQKAEGGLIGHYATGNLVKGAASSALTHLAERFPNLIPGILKQDVKTGKEFVGKALSPEEMALQAARKAAQKEIEKGNYKPFFDVSQRFPVDPANYPMQGNTITDVVPKKAATAEKWSQLFDTPEALARLREAYGKAKADPLAHNWYAMGQLENEFIKELGPEAGRKAFRERFATPMAATTGGADPTANLLSAYYANHMRQAGKPMGASSAELPHPIGGRYIMGNLGQYENIINKGQGLTTNTPKRFNFASNFMGHSNRPTLDEQMTGIFDPRLAAPPGDSYGIMEGVLNKAAAAEGVSPVNFQEVAWAGQKGTKGKPMIQHVNEAIERTSRVTGKSPEDVVRDSLIHARSPLYGGAAAGLGGLSQYEDR